jgi:hypothetical protein
MTKLIENPCGLSWMAMATLWTPDGQPRAGLASIKRVDGQWRIRSREGVLC